MNLEDKVKDVVESFCNRSESFTSLDISNHVKQNGFTDKRHRDIAQIVRYLYVDGAIHQYNYTRSLIQVQISSGMIRNAYLYHNQTVCPDDYNKRVQVAIPPVTDSVPDTNTMSTFTRVVNSNQDNVQSGDDANNIQIRHNKRDGRLELPAKWIKKLDWLEGYAIHVVHNENTLIAIRPDDLTEDDKVVAITHISCGRLRIPKTAFINAEFAYNSAHSVMLENNGITIYKEGTFIF